MFLCDNQWKFLTFSILYIWNRISGKRKSFSKNWSRVFYLKALRLETHHFQTKLPYQNPMLRQIKWWVQNVPITKNGVLPVTTLSFWKFCFSSRTSYQEFVWCINEPNAYWTFCKRWYFIWWCFFPVSILNKAGAFWEILFKYHFLK